MLRDARHQQVIQKFSFIESLNLSRQIASADREILERIDLDKPTPKSIPNASSAIVTPNDRTANIDANWEHPDSNNYNLDLAEIVRYSASQKQEDKFRKHPNYFGKILFSLACSYCIFALWWLFGDRASSILTTLMGGEQITVSKSDLEFIEYMEQSVSAIESQLEAEKTADKDREVVYVPVYTPNSNPPAFPQVSGNNAPTNPAPAAIASTQSSPSSTNALKIPAPPPLPAPTPLAAESTPTPTKIAAVETKPAIEHTLIGIFELGEDRTAALIKVNGQTRRFWLGEKIGNSEWILESVTNNSAKINNDGQIRSIAVGETF